MKTKIFIMQLLLQLALNCHAQEILGVVTDRKGEPVINASVRITKGGVLKAGAVTDYDGKYSAKPLDTGLYDVTASYLGMKPKTMTGVVVTPGDKTEVNFVLQQIDGKVLKEVIVMYKKPLIDKYKTNTVLTGAEIRTKPTTNTTDLVALTPGVYQSRKCGDISSDGARTAGNVYIIDGVQVQGATGISTHGSTEQIPLQGKVNQYNTGTEDYKRTIENDFMLVKNNPLSTMSVDVDRASYSNVRRILEYRQMPPVDAVRTEEMINYFNYDYPAPKGDKPIAIETELTQCPWNNNHYLLRIGMQAKKLAFDALPASNLVFLVDVSGSMDEPDKLPLLKSALKLLVKQLRADDKVSIVTYAGNAGLALKATKGDNKKEILHAIDRLEAGGSTAGGEGILLAYNIARENFIEGGNNRVILATDGDFNVGITDNSALENLISEKKETGIFLTCLGFGSGNLKDARMEMLADKGNGNYSYVDNINEAEKVLVKEFKGTMFTVAKDVKSQIEFNPAKVESYRLIGYENRMLATEDFKNDKKDAGDMGAGHSVTVLYELVPSSIDAQPEKDSLKYGPKPITPAQFANEIATIKFRYKQPTSSESNLLTHVVANECKEFGNASENTRYAAAVAMFGMLLKSSVHKGATNYDDVIKLAESSKGKDMGGYRKEFIEMVSWAKSATERKY